jgi:hypothetical protein
VRFVAAVLLLPAGAATALATVALHELWWGLLLGMAATVAALLALGRGWWTRLPFGLGWAALVAWMAPSRTEGDYVIASDAPGYTLLVCAVLVLVFSVATLPRPAGGRP